MLVMPLVKSLVHVQHGKGVALPWHVFLFLYDEHDL